MKIFYTAGYIISNLHSNKYQKRPFIFNKIGKIMKFTCIFFFMSIWGSIASTYSQSSTALKLHITNGTISDVLKEIEKQSDYIFVYNVDEKNLSDKVSVELTNETIDKVLNQILLEKNISYKITNNHVALYKKSEIDKQSETDQDNSKKIKGVVVDELGIPIIGANIIVKGTTIGTVTDIDGNFTLDAPQKAVLIVSYIGYTDKLIAVGNKTALSIKMAEDTKSLDEVVVIGYGTQRKGSVATAITTIKSETLQNRPVQTVGEALQGQVAGMSVTSTGKPGGSPSINLRGATSLNGEGSPLILIDGVPGDFNFLNPEDIESINVLKDAASAAIYGSRAANGILLVTTKRGKLGKPTFRYNGSVGVNTPTDMPQTVSSGRYARAINEANANGGSTTPVWTADEIALFDSGTDPNRFPNTDWLGLAIQNSLTTRHGLEASGGTEKVKYLISGSMDHQTGVFPEITQNVFNIRSNTDVAISKKLNLAFDLRYQVRDLDEVLGYDDLYKQLLSAHPTDVAYYDDGSYGYNPGFFINPLVGLYEGGHKESQRHDASGLFKIDYEILKGLKFTGIANVNYIFGITAEKSRELKYESFFTDDVTIKGQNNLKEKRDYASYYNLQALLNYNKKIGKHNLDALFGYQQESKRDNNMSAWRNGYPTDLVYVLNGGPKDNWGNDGNIEHWAIASFLGRLNYDYNGKYILSTSFRSDASSRFAAENRWASFFSAAAAWRLSSESFMEGTKSWLDDLKIRASWGQNGSSSGLGLYPSYSTIAMDAVVLGNNYMQTAKLNTIGNTTLGWEQTDMINVGLDFRTLNSRLGFTAEYYTKTTNDILIRLPAPLEYGFGDQPVNIGSIGNKGWEIQVSWNDKINDFSYGISANLSDNKNEVLDLGDTGPWKNGYKDILDASKTYDGYIDAGLPFRSYYGYESMGLFQSADEVKDAPFQNSKTGAGDVRYVDQLTVDTDGDGIMDAGDGKINADDRVVIGDRYPHYLFGINLNAEYKGFDISAFFQGIGSKDIIFNNSSVRPFYDSTLYEHQLDYWTSENPEAAYPRLLKKDDGAHNYEASDYWKMNAGYVRLKNLQLGYTLPKSALGDSGFGRIRVYFTANNLLTFDSFVPGWDPEATGARSYPFAKTYSFGLNVQF